MLKMYWVEQQLKYDGRQLASLFAFRNYQIQGNSIVAFRGACTVELTEMVDIADVLAEAHIYSEEMLHFIVEHFDQDLEKTVLRQRLLIAIIMEVLQQEGAKDLIRKGDDIYSGDNKLSVSIATTTRVSTMIHTGLNISSNNTPVPTVSLPELAVYDIQHFAGKVMEKYVAEMESIWLARCKVRGVD